MSGEWKVGPRGESQRVVDVVDPLIPEPIVEATS